MRLASRSSCTCRSRSAMRRTYRPAFKGKSGIGQYGDKMMEGDYHVGLIMDALKELELDENTLLVLASDNGPRVTTHEFGYQGSPDMETRARSAASWARPPKVRSAPRVHPLARQDQARYQLVRHVLGDGLHADFRGHHRSQAAHGSCDRWRGPDGRALRQERGGKPGVPADLRWPRHGGRAVETMAGVLQR